MKNYETPEIELLKLVADANIAANDISAGGGGFSEDIGEGDFDLDL